jgi:hypothetical protein
VIIKVDPRLFSLANLATEKYKLRSSQQCGKLAQDTVMLVFFSLTDRQYL